MFNFNNISALGENDTHVFDVSGNGNNGTANGDAAPVLGGKYSGAYTFDGDGDYVQATQTGLATGANPRTIMAWINATNTATTRVPFAYGESGAGHNGEAFGVYLTGAEDLRFWGAGSADFSTGTTVTTNVWHHIAVTYDGSNVRVYLDAVQVGATTARTLDTGAQGLFVGSDGDIDPADYPYTGLVDELMVWNMHLTPAEIYLFYASNLRKYDADKWELYVNQSLNVTDGLLDGNYTFFAAATNSTGTENITSTRTVIIDTTFPTITISLPANNTNSSDNGLDVNYTVSDINLDSCWYSNDTMTSNTTLANCANVTSVTWSDGQHNVTVYVNDSAGNENSSSVTFTIDATYPTWENNKTNLTSATTSGSSVYFNITLNDTNPDQYIFSWYNGSDWNNYSAASYTNGQEIEVTNTTTISSGDINWTWYFNDTFGNNNQTDVFGVTIDLTDTDGDGLLDSSDPLVN